MLLQQPLARARAATLACVTAELLEWFYQVKRILPWRRDRNAYRVWISEIMLQQTQVAVVVPYFERWLERFPDVQILAAAPIDDVLKLWEGLGYYRRARNLYKTAQLIALGREGVFPNNYEAWLELPGVGPYTAAAIASIVDGEAVVAVDGNVKRVAARVFGIAGEIKAEEVRARLQPYLPTNTPGDFNEALMELGATVCTPRNSACSKCPLANRCVAFQENRLAELPTPKPKRARPHRERYALIDLQGTAQDAALWLRQRAPEEMLPGLWGFVLLEEKPVGARAFPAAEHIYTHFSTRVTPVLTPHCQHEGRYVAVSDLGSLALSTLDHKILDILREAELLD